MIILVNILSNCPKTENFHAIRKCLIKKLNKQKKGASVVRYPVAFFMPERKKSGEEEDFIM